MTEARYHTESLAKTQFASEAERTRPSQPASGRSAGHQGCSKRVRIRTAFPRTDSPVSLPAVDYKTGVEMLPQHAARRTWTKRLRTLQTLVSLAFRPFCRKVEGCMCGTIQEAKWPSPLAREVTWSGQPVGHGASGRGALPPRRMPLPRPLDCSPWRQSNLRHSFLQRSRCGPA